MKLTHEPLELKLTLPFTISRRTSHAAHNTLVTIDGEGLGEAAPYSFYGELPGTVTAFLDQLGPQITGLADLPISTAHQIMDRIAGNHGAAKAAVDLALYDLLGKRLGAPVYQLLGLDPSQTPRTSYTIGIDTPEIMAQKAAAAAQYPILKVKVGTGHDHENLEAIRNVRPDAVIRVDANAAWTAKEAVARLDDLMIYELEFVEQPVAPNDLEGLGFVAGSIPLPVIADESCLTPADVVRVAPYVDGINIKLMKCGGIYPALQMIAIARAHNLQVMMGCMIESSLGITAAAQISPLIDYADLDSHLLIDNDPYRGVQVEDGKLVLPDAPGLGLTGA